MLLQSAQKLYIHDKLFFVPIFPFLWKKIKYLLYTYGNSDRGIWHICPLKSYWFTLFLICNKNLFHQSRNFPPPLVYEKVNHSDEAKLIYLNSERLFLPATSVSSCSHLKYFTLSLAIIRSTIWYRSLISHFKRSENFSGKLTHLVFYLLIFAIQILIIDCQISIITY